MITKKFIETVHYYFDELGYRINSNPVFEDFQKQAEWTLTHSKEFEDARVTVNITQFCIKHWYRIVKIFETHADYFSSLKYEGRTNIDIVSDEEASGEFYITNGLYEASIKDIYVSSISFEADDNEDIFMFDMNFENGKYSFFDDGNYYIKKASMSSVKMKLFDSDDNCITNIVLSEDYDIFLENNHSPYKLIAYEDFVGVYRKDYLRQLNSEYDASVDNLIATIQWDLLDKKHSRGLVKASVFDDEDIEMILLFATSNLILFNNFKKFEKRKNFFTFLLASR